MTNGGSRSWRRCGQPLANEDDLCIPTTGEARWLSSADECAWHGVLCHEDTGDVISLGLSKSNEIWFIVFVCFVRSNPGADAVRSYDQDPTV